MILARVYFLSFLDLNAIFHYNFFSFISILEIGALDGAWTASVRRSGAPGDRNMVRMSYVICPSPLFPSK